LAIEGVQPAIPENAPFEGKFVGLVLLSILGSTNIIV
jgi:hypothetical protein